MVLKPMRVVLDTNVLVSALVFKGRLAILGELIAAKKITPCLSTATLDEFILVLHRPKFRRALIAAHVSVNEIVQALLAQSVMVSDRDNIEQIHSDPSDTKFLTCAVASKASYIVTGDKHLLSLKSVNHIPIVTPADFLKLLNN
jgi:putative PIN family toxin of toxin-antitoxin system